MSQPTSRTCAVAVTVTAPADGVIYQASSFREGVMLAAGQPVFALVETGATATVLAAPQAAYTAALIASHRDLATPPLIREAGR